MANSEIYDFVSTVTADNDVTLTLKPQRTLVETGTKNQIVLLGDDGSEERISLSDTSIFKVRLSWDVLNESDSGTLFDFWNNAAKGNGRLESFKWEHPVDGHTYVVRFDCDIPRTIRVGNLYGVTNITLKVLGRIAD